jgi:hypothetical protein
MALFDEQQKMKFCPLCHNRWHIIEEPRKDGRCYFVCDTCKISIWVRDTLLGHFEDFEKINCPMGCDNQNPMRFFCRADPGYGPKEKNLAYVCWECPKCKIKIETHDPDAHKHAMTLKEVKEKYKGQK